MVSSSDIVLSVIGFLFSIYGGIIQDLLSLTLGLLIIFLSITLRLNSQEQDIKILNAQINTQNEPLKIRAKIKNLENEIYKK